MINISFGCRHTPSVLLFFWLLGCFFFFSFSLYFLVSVIFFPLLFVPYFIFPVVLLLVIRFCSLVDPWVICLWSRPLGCGWDLYFSFRVREEEFQHGDFLLWGKGIKASNVWVSLEQICYYIWRLVDLVWNWNGCFDVCYLVDLTRHGCFKAFCSIL